MNPGDVVAYKGEQWTVDELDGLACWISNGTGRRFPAQAECTQIAVGDKHSAAPTATIAAAEPGMQESAAPVRGGPATSDAGTAASTRAGSAAVPLARTTDPQTSHDAAHTARGRARQDAWLVLVAHRNAGDQGLTGTELEDATDRPYQSVGPRRPALCAAGWIEAWEGCKRPNRRGNPEQVYRITTDGSEYVAAAIASRGAA